MLQCCSVAAAIAMTAACHEADETSHLDPAPRVELSPDWEGDSGFSVSYAKTLSRSTLPDAWIDSELLVAARSEKLTNELLIELANGARDQRDLSDAIYLAGRLKNNAFVDVLKDIALRDRIAEGDETALERERELSIVALGAIGAENALEEIWESSPPNVALSAMVELHQLNSDRWPMRELPQSFFNDVSPYSYFPDDEHDDDDDDDDDSVNHGCLHGYSGEALNYVDAVSEIQKDGDSLQVDSTVEALALSPTYACGVVSPSAATSAEIPLTSEWCNSATIGEYWGGYSFNDSWNSSMGFDAACDLNLPLGRTFNAIHLLHTASPTPATSYTDFSGDFLRWAGNYARREIPSLRASCASYYGRANWAALKKNRYVTLGLSAFYSGTTVVRASTIVHEARHTERCKHNGGDGSSPCAANSKSCDESWADGCKGVGSPSGAGAYGWEVRWLQALLSGAKPGLLNDSQRTAAMVEANRLLRDHFDNEPGFRLNLWGAAYAYP